MRLECADASRSCADLLVSAGVDVCLHCRRILHSPVRTELNLRPSRFHTAMIVFMLCDVRIDSTAPWKRIAESDGIADKRQFHGHGHASSDFLGRPIDEVCVCPYLYNSICTIAAARATRRDNAVIWCRCVRFHLFRAPTHRKRSDHRLGAVDVRSHNNVAGHTAYIIVCRA